MNKNGFCTQNLHDVAIFELAVKIGFSRSVLWNESDNGMQFG